MWRKLWWWNIIYKQQIKHDRNKNICFYSSFNKTGWEITCQPIWWCVKKRNNKKNLKRHRRFFGCRGLQRVSPDTDSTQEKSFKCVDYIRTMKRCQRQTALSISNRKESHTNWILTSCSDIQHVSYPVISFLTSVAEKMNYNLFIHDSPDKTDEPNVKILT